MRPGLGRRSGAAAVLLLALVVATSASPAAAAEGGPAITIESPRADAVLESETVTVKVRVTAADSLIHRLKDVTMTAGSDSRKFDCPDSPCSFSWELTRRSNGPYSVKAVATQTIILLGTPGPGNELTRSFAVAAPAAKPVLDAPKVNEARSVDLSWSRNTEPDILYYAVFRKDPSAAEPQWVGGKIKQPTSGSKVSFTDTTTAGHPGGDFTYQVFAVRKGATDGSEVVSGPSAARTATVPVLATTSTSTAPAPGTPLASTTTVKPGTSGGVDLSGFLSSRSAPVAPPVITVPEPPDTGFEGSLPFGARPPSLDDIEEGEAEAVPPGGPRSIISRISPGRPLVPIAGGLVLLMLAMHMRLLNSRTRPVADGGDLPVEAAAPPPPPPPPPAPPPPARPPAPASPPPTPPPAALELEPDDDDEQDWAPVAAAPLPAPAPAVFDLEADDEDWAAEPEPEPEIVTLWAPDPEPEPEPEPEQEPAPPAFDPDAIEVFEVVSSRSRLARSGSR